MQQAIKRNDSKEIQGNKLEVWGCLPLFKWYLPIEKEEKNGSSARQSTVQYMVLAMLDG